MDTPSDQSSSRPRDIAELQKEREEADKQVENTERNVVKPLQRQTKEDFAWSNEYFI